MHRFTLSKRHGLLLVSILLALPSSLYAANYTWLGTPGNIWSTNPVDTNWSGPTSYFVDANSATFDNTAPGSHTVNLSGTVSPSSITVNTATTYNFSGSGAIAGAASLVKNGAGTLTIANSGVNTYTGGVTINSGTLDLATGINAASFLGADSSPININDGTLKISAAALNNAASNHPMTLGSLNSTILVNAFNLTISQNGIISGSGNLSATGAGTLVLSAANTFTGQTIIQNGTVVINAIAPLGTPQPLGQNANPLVFGAAGGHLKYTGPDVQSAMPIALGTAGGSIAVAQNSTLTLTGPVTGGSFTADGYGTLILTATPKNYTGQTTVHFGTLIVDSTSSISSAPLSMFPSGTVKFSNSNNAVVTQSLAALSGDFGSIVDIAANITLNVGSGNTDSIYQGSFTGAGSLNKVGSASFTIYGGISQAGGTTVAAGTLVVSSPGSVGAITNNANLNFWTSSPVAATTILGAGTTTLIKNTSVTANSLRQSALVLQGTAANNTAKLTIAQSSPFPAGDNNMVSVVKSLSIDNNGAGTYFATLDLKNNDLIIDYTDTNVSPLSAVEAMVKSGYNSGTWTGKGITSSSAATRPDLYTLAVLDNVQLGAAAINNFDGISTSNHKQVIVKFTWIADINLDGVVDSNDAFAFGNQYIEGLTGVHHLTGDLNYDGIIDSNDAFLFGNAYNETLQHLPEPASLSLLALGALALLKRRRS